MKKITIAGSIPLLLAGIKKDLQLQFTEQKINICSKLENLIDHLEQTSPSTLILDIVLEKRYNQKYLSKILLKFPNLYSIIISTKTNIDYIQKWFKLGLRGYADSSITPDELIEAVRLIQNGERYIQPKLQQAFTEEILCLPTRIKHLDLLTPREREVIQLIVNEFTTKEIATQLYISPSTAETHRLNIIHKLGVKNTAGLVREAVLNHLYL